MATTLQSAESADQPIDESAPEIVRTRKGRRRAGPVRRWLIVTHRWVSLILDLVLLVLTASGALLVYQDEIQRWVNPDAYAATPTDNPIPLARALDIVADADPGFEPFSALSVDWGDPRRQRCSQPGPEHVLRIPGEPTQVLAQLRRPPRLRSLVVGRGRRPDPGDVGVLAKIRMPSEFPSC